MSDERHPPVIAALNEYLEAERLIGQATDRYARAKATLEDAVLMALEEDPQARCVQPPANGSDDREVIVRDCIVRLHASDHRPCISVSVVERIG